MHNRIIVWRGSLLAVTLLAISAGSTLAQQSPTSSAQPASYETTAPVVPAAAANSVRFTRQAPLVGDQLEQTLAVSLRLNTVVRQNQKVFNRGKMSIKRHQRRLVTTSDVVDGMTVAVAVRYLEATKATAAGASDADLQTAETLPQPVQGKVYRCRREGEQLRVTDEAGTIPPLDEFEIVSGNMESLGRVNPLGDYLAGRTVTVGEELTLPNDVAEKLLGLGNELGKVSRFALKLQEVRTIDGATCAIFLASIDAASADSSQMRLEVEGPLVIQVDTCRAVQASFTGPIGMSETRGSLTATYQMTGTGRMHVEIASVYRDLPR